MFVIGVDPGLTGALSLIDSRRGLLACADIPTCENGVSSGSMKRWVDLDGMRSMLDEWASQHDFAREDVHAVIERPIAMPSLPAQTIASQFDTFAVLRAVFGCRLMTARVHYVNPQEWKKLFGIRTDKGAARECCKRLYPSAPVSRVKDHNRAESILIGHWFLRGHA